MTINFDALGAAILWGAAIVAESKDKTPQEAFALGANRSESFRALLLRAFNVPPAGGDIPDTDAPTVGPVDVDLRETFQDALINQGLYPVFGSDSGIVADTEGRTGRRRT